MGTGKSGPAAPDFMGLANQMGLISRQNVVDQMYANRPNIVTPNGSMTWNRPDYNDNYFGAYPEGGTSGSGSSLRSQDLWDKAYNYMKDSVERQNASSQNNPTGSGSSTAPSGRWSGLPDPNGIDGGYGGDYTDPGTGNGPGGTYDPNDPGRAGPPQPGDYAPPGNDPFDQTMNITLDPQLQEANDIQQQNTLDRSKYSQQMLGEGMQQYNENKNYWDQLPGLTDGTTARNNAENAIYGRMTSRLDPQWQQREDRQRTMLANQGIGSPLMETNQKAWNTFDQGRNDAYQTAMNEAIMGGGQEATRQQGLDMTARNQGISEGQQKSYQGLNAFNAFNNGNQIGMPSFPGFSQAGMAQTPDLLGAAGSQYGAAMNTYGLQQAGLNSTMGGISSIASMIPYLMML